MTQRAASRLPTQSQPEPPSRNRLALAALLTVLGCGVALSALVVAPFVPALAWAFALFVVANPFYHWLRRRFRAPTIPAGLAVMAVTLLLLIPTALIAWQVGVQASERVGQVQEFINSGELERQIQRYPLLAELYRRATGSGGRESASADLLPSVGRASAWLQSFAWAALQVAVALFTLFFLFRDEDKVAKTIRSYVPMSERETTYFFEEIRRMTHATIYGNVVVALIQGALGGLMFAFVGIPGALLWGVVMAILSLIPNAGAFVIWLPAAAILAAQGSWGKATFLAAWGALVVGSIDNLLYPMLVGKEARLHTLPVFFSVVGGLIVFGAAGLVLGPAVMAGTLALVDVLKRRTEHERSAANPR